jgi:hypothetical protein
VKVTFPTTPAAAWNWSCTVAGAAIVVIGACEESCTKVRIHSLLALLQLLEQPAVVFEAVPVVRESGPPFAFVKPMLEVACTSVIPATDELIVTVQDALVPPPL